jgi:CheY-like chemotaxis protein
MPALQPIWPRVGPWLVVRELGVGGMGTVYAATGPGHAGEVALKVINPLRSGSGKARLLAEARAAAAVRHPNLVRCLDIGESCDVPYLVMELVTGGTASNLIAAGKTTTAQIQAVAADIGAGLQALHAAGVLHRDIKPANILRDAGGRWMLADFGLARLGDGSAGVTMAGNTVGTPDYMGPEQATAEVLDGRADLYSLGASLYHIATGSPPHRGQTTWEILGDVLREPFPDPLTERPDLDPHITAVIRKLGAKRLSERYADAQQLLDDLALVGAGRAPVHASFRSSEQMLHAPVPTLAKQVPVVVLIDDDPLARTLFGAVLRKRGWEVRQAEDGVRGLDMVVGADVVVCDLKLPDCDGDEVLRRIGLAHPGLPRVAMTNAFAGPALDRLRAMPDVQILEKSATTPGRLAGILGDLIGSSRKVEAGGAENIDRVVQESADAALARIQILVQRLAEQGEDDDLFDEIAASGRGLCLAATATGMPAVSALAAALEGLARQLRAAPQRRTLSTRRTMTNAVTALRHLHIVGGRQSPARALVVDDDPTSRVLAGGALTKVGIAHAVAASPQAALAELAARPCDLLLTDVVMDGGSGFQLAAQARAMPGLDRLPVIFVTGLDDFARFFIADPSASADLLLKPYLLIELGLKALALHAMRATSPSNGA